MSSQRGTVKWFNNSKGFGFIAKALDLNLHVGRDVIVQEIAGAGHANHHYGVGILGNRRVTIELGHL